MRCHAVVIASAHGQVAWIFRRRRIKRFHLRYSAATPHGQGQISCILPPTLSDRLRANGYAHVRGHEPSEHRQAGETGWSTSTCALTWRVRLPVGENLVPEATSVAAAGFAYALCIPLHKSLGDDGWIDAGRQSE